MISTPQLEPPAALRTYQHKPSIAAGQPGMLISEIYHSFQGEGRLTGTSSVFVRTSGCNLRCEFCDTPFASWQPGGVQLGLDAIVGQVLNSSIQKERSAQHVVLTGGEPLLPRDVIELCRRLNDLGFHLTIETAGTIFRELHCDLMSISPKFANSTPSVSRAGEWRTKHEQTRQRPAIVQQLMKRYDYQLKFVVDHPRDLDEIETYLSVVQPDSSERVMLMPQGVDVEQLAVTESWLRPICEEKGFVFCPRMHIQWYGNIRGT